MNNAKIWILVTGIVVMVSGFLLYSTLRSKEADRVSFMAKAQEMQSKIMELSKLEIEIEQLKKEKAALEAKTQSDIAVLEALVSDTKKNEAAARSKVDALTKEKESLTKYMENNNIIVGKLQKKIEALELEKKQLLESAQKHDEPIVRFVDPMSEGPEETFSAPERGSKLAGEEAVDLGRIILRKSTSQPATVEHVNSLYGFVVLSAGTNDGLRKDSIVNITRNNRLVAKAVIKKIREEAASAVTLPEWTRDEIRVGDLVSVNSPAP